MSVKSFFNSISFSLPVSLAGPKGGAKGNPGPLPKHDQFRTIPEYVNAIKGHFAGDPQALLDEIKHQPLSVKSAVMDSSRELRSYLGIRQGSQYQPDKQIPLDKAPAALADVIVMLAQENDKSKNGRLHRTIYRLDQMLRRGMSENDGPRGQQHYNENITQALCHLLNNFGALKADAQSKLAPMIQHYTHFLPYKEKVVIGEAARAALKHSKLGGSHFQVPLDQIAEIGDKRITASDYGRSKILRKANSMSEMSQLNGASHSSQQPQQTNDVGRRHSMPIPNLSQIQSPIFNGMTGGAMIASMKSVGWSDQNLAELRDDIRHFAAMVQTPGMDFITSKQLTHQFNQNHKAVDGSFFPFMSPETFDQYLQLADAIGQDLVQRGVLIRP